MKLPVEAWAEDAHLPGEALDALREACVCHRAGAYRAGLLFSYVAWGLVLRRRVLAAKCPPDYPAAKWDKLQRDMQDEDCWDREIFGATQSKKPAAVFNVSDDLRMQVRYWKDRRNDCAHSKQNSITQAHVEALWEFLRCNLDKFVPGGSIEDLIERLRVHFDANITPPGANCDELARLVGSAVPTARRREFLEEVDKIFKPSTGKIAFRWPGIARFVESLLRVADDSELRHATVEFLASDMERICETLHEYPNLTVVLTDRAPLVRQLWRTSLKKAHPGTLRIYASLLRQGLVPAEEVAEANSHIIASYSPPPPSPEDADTLNCHGFFAALYQRAFVDGALNGFSWGNANAALVAFYVQSFLVDDLVAEKLSEFFASHPYPYTAQEQLRQLFDSNPAKRNEFVSKLQALNLSWPEPLLGPPPEGE